MDSHRSIHDLIEASFHESVATKQRALESLGGVVAEAAALLIETYRRGGKALFCGNGGSAADAQHLAAEFVGRYLRDRRPLPSLALTVNSSVVTAIGNDYSFDQIFARQVRALAQPGDVVVGISTSGNSADVLEAFHAARELGVKTIGFTGRSGGRMAALSDLLLNVPTDQTPRIQECHILIGHILCQAVEEALF